MADAQQLQRAQEGGLRRRVQEVKAQHIGHAQRLELQHRGRQVATPDLWHSLLCKLPEGRLGVQPICLAWRVAACCGENTRA
jgi:hypothetical protein